MSERLPIDPAEAAELRARLADCAVLLRETRHLDEASQRALAELVLELAEVIDPDSTSEHVSHLAESSAQLIHALHGRHDAGLISAARERLEQAAARAETEAPVATGVVRQFIDALASIGI